MPVNNEERKTRYWLLKKSGFTSKEARTFKDLSIDKIRQIIQAREQYNEAERNAFKIYEALVKEIRYNG